ncbi:hypothetical protein [Bradyrhizobium sp. LHD-71]|uniref:hypothetical protein n=1 Tax=Bradyrhizobium sp. LHD-71 TaxID=3072141 RepID=UPI00280F19DC|nr:hypothetical protein [Bradyrhizobium sp. LHD-71]MDQ8730809.1 hypothetical protein [Bradyrhizobium sp. LHD-71]
MLWRLVWGALFASAVAGSTAAEPMNPEQARQFVAGKLFAFSCVDGTRGAGRIYQDGSVTGSVQFSGSGPVRSARLPVNTIRVGATQVCASLKGLPFEPCFNLDKTSEASFRGSVQGMSFAWCEFRKHGNSLLVARAERGPRSQRSRSIRSADASRPETVGKVETPKVEGTNIEPPKPEPNSLELRRATE